MSKKRSRLAPIVAVSLALGLFGCNIGNGLGGATSANDSSCIASSGLATPNAPMGVHSRTWNAGTGTRAGQIAQPFRASRSGTISTAELDLMQGQIPAGMSIAGNLELTIQDDAFNAPSGNLLGDSEFPARNITSTAPNFYSFTFSPAVEVVAGQTYWLVLDANFQPGNDYFLWAGTSTNSISSTGIAMYFTGGQWAPASEQMSLNNGLQPNRELIYRVGCLN